MPSIVDVVAFIKTCDDAYKRYDDDNDDDDDDDVDDVDDDGDDDDDDAGAPPFADHNRIPTVNPI